MNWPRNFKALGRIGRLLRPHAAGEGRALASGILLGMVIVTLHVLQPWPLKWILDYLTDAHDANAVAVWVTSAPTRGLVTLSVLFVVVSLGIAGVQYTQLLLLNGLGNRVLFRFRAALFSHILRQPLAFHETHEVGELLTRIVYDTSRLRRGLNGILIRIFQTVALFVATIAVLLWLNPLLGLVLAGGGAVALGAMHYRGRRIARAARKQRKREGALAALVANELMSVRELQTFGISGSGVEQRFARGNVRSLRQEQKVRRLAAGLSARVDTLMAISIATVLWLGARSVMAGDLTAGDLVVFFSYAVSLRTPFTRFARQTARIGRTWACGERLMRIAERASKITDEPGAVSTTPLQNRIVLEDLAVKAPRRRRTDRKWTLDGLSGEFPAGQRIAVLGSNGAGKSTLLRMLLRLVDPNRGRVLFDDNDIKTFTLDSLRSQMSVVFQDSVLSGLTVRDNLSLGMPDVALDAIRAAATRAHVNDFIEKLPKGYDTPVHRGGRLFSGGQRQLLAIARALLRDGHVWLLDEPLAGLDPATAAELTAVLLDATKGRTTFWVTHDPALVSRFDRVEVLHLGKSAFAGTPDSYFAWLESGSGKPSIQPRAEV